MKARIDRFEGEKAVLISESQQIIADKSDLPKEAKEGDLLDINFTIDNVETSKTKKRIKKLLSEVLGERR